MDAVIDLIVPETERVTFNIMGDIETVTGDRPYKYRDKLYYNIEDATAAAVAFDLELRKLNVTTEEIYVKFNKFLNPPIDLPLPVEQYYFDIDKGTDVDNEYYVHEEDYVNSCPHDVAHEKRHISDGIVSCYIDNLKTYTKILAWYRTHYNNLPFKIAKPIEDMPIEDAKYFEYMHIIIEDLIYDMKMGKPQIKTIINTYLQGINDNLHLNALTRKRLYFDLFNWTQKTTDDRDLKLLEKAETIYDLVSMNIALDLKEVIELVLENKYKTNMKEITLVFDAYFQNIELYTDHIYNISQCRWEPAQDDVKFIRPNIKGNFSTMSEKDSLELFRTVYIRINNINKINKV